MSIGARTWCFPDGYLPEKNDHGPLEAHEALTLLNVGNRDAKVLIDFFFEDQESTIGIPVIVGAKRVKCFRLDDPDDIVGLVIPALTAYSIQLRSDTSMLVQFGRLDTTQANMAYYVGVGYCE